MSIAAPTSERWHITCPRCHRIVTEPPTGGPPCDACRPDENGVVDLLADDRRDALAPFLETYTAVRLAEGRGEYTDEERQSLPDCPAGHGLAGQWRIRAASYAALEKVLRQRLGVHARILDLGAGTGWLSHRLALAGFRPCAIDICADAADGLGAGRRFATDWPRIRAEFDDLPIRDNHADAAVFNASFHYCTDPDKAIAEAMRVVRPGGWLFIVDTPVYQDGGSGTQMLEEQQQYIEQLIGRRSDSLPAIGYLTWRRLAAVGRRSGLDWQVLRPWYGWRWALRPILARLRRSREPARFAVLYARKP